MLKVERNDDALAKALHDLSDPLRFRASRCFGITLDQASSERVRCSLTTGDTTGPQTGLWTLTGASGPGHLYPIQMAPTQYPTARIHEAGHHPRSIPLWYGLIRVLP